MQGRRVGAGPHGRAAGEGEVPPVRGDPRGGDARRRRAGSPDRRRVCPYNRRGRHLTNPHTSVFHSLADERNANKGIRAGEQQGYSDDLHARRRRRPRADHPAGVPLPHRRERRCAKSPTGLLS